MISASSIDELNQWLQEHNLSGQWMRWGAPRPAPESGAYLWKWADVYPAC